MQPLMYLGEPQGYVLSLTNFLLAIAVFMSILSEAEQGKKFSTPVGRMGSLSLLLLHDQLLQYAPTT